MTEIIWINRRHNTEYTERLLEEDQKYRDENYLRNNIKEE